MVPSSVTISGYFQIIILFCYYRNTRSVAVILDAKYMILFLFKREVLNLFELFPSLTRLVMKSRINCV